MFNLFKDFFGSGNSREPPNDDRRERFLRDESDPFSSFHEGQDNNWGFQVFGNPLEMHRYFESQVNSMLKSFGIPGDGGFFGLNESGPDMFSNFLEGPQQLQPPVAEGELRDQYLKHGYQQPNTRERTDSDLDGKIDVADLDSVFSNERQQLKPYVEKPRIQTFGRQIMTKAFTNHNGVIESHQTVRDHEGNEETVVTYKQGDREYTKITKTDKNGQKEIKENFVNLSEEDLGRFLGAKNMITDDSSTEVPDGKKPPNWFPFDKYFR